jgi:hypothetical protein
MKLKTIFFKKLIKTKQIDIKNQGQNQKKRNLKGWNENIEGAWISIKK